MMMVVEKLVDDEEGGPMSAVGSGNISNITMRLDVHNAMIKKTCVCR